jgi:serine/threonine-protein kinase
MEIRFVSSQQIRGAADAELPLPVARAPDLSGRILGARYSLRRRIGGGSMGTVYEARDMTLGTAVAVKVMHPEYSDDESFRRRFHQEALIGARLRHEHSVAVTDLGQSDDGLLYSVMEYLEGESLDGLLSGRAAPVPWRRVVTIAMQVCAALQAAHDRGIIHRDIKPGNCFLVRRDRRDPAEEDDAPFTFIKVLDLGLARVMPASGRPTPPGRLGAPEYLAPEQVQGSVCDHRVDLYALGVMMYQLLTRRLPFAAATPAAIMRQHIEATPVPPRRLRPDAEIPASLEAVVLRALAKDPAERFPSALAMAQAIRAAAAEAEAETIAIDESVDDGPTGLWRRVDVSTAMMLTPGLGEVPSLRGGLIGLALALACICIAVGALWNLERPPTDEATALAQDAAHAAPTAHVDPTLAQTADHVDTPAQTDATATTLARTAEPVAPATPAPTLARTAEPVAPTTSTPAQTDATATRTLAQTATYPDPPATPTLAQLAPPPAPALAMHATPFAPVAVSPGPVLDPGALPAPSGPGPDDPPFAAPGEPPVATAVASAPRPRPARPPKHLSEEPAAVAGPHLTPGAPPERTFQRLADLVAPGVHRCMRRLTPGLAALTVELTVGGPRRSAVALGLQGADTPELRACLAPLLARIEFPASERTARYAHTYKP